MSGRPRSTADERQRRSYLQLLALLARVDGAVADAEVATLRAVADELDLVWLDADLTRALDVHSLALWVREPGLRARLIGDLGRLALADGVVEPLELALIQYLAQRWELDLPAREGVDWGADSPPGDLRTAVGERRRAGARERGDPPEPVRSEALGEADALRRLAERVPLPAALAPYAPPHALTSGWWGRVVRAGGCAELFALLGVIAAAMSAPPLFVIGLGVLRGRPLSSLIFPLLVFAPAIGAVLPWLLPRLRQRRFYRHGVFLPAVILRTEEGALPWGSRTCVVSRFRYVYTCGGAIGGGSSSESRYPDDPRPLPRPGDVTWVFVDPQDPQHHVSWAAATSYHAVPWFPPNVRAEREEEVEVEPRDLHEPEAEPRVAPEVQAVGTVRVPVREGQVCPFCRTDLRGEGSALVTCAACYTVFHRECLRELGSCTTFGCRNRRA